VRALKALAAAAVLAAATIPSPSQGALDRALRAWERADDSAAHAALLELFASDEPSRAADVQASVEAFRNAGGTDVWLEAATRRARVHPNDAVLQFYLGAAWQDLKHLHRAEEALGQARALAPDNPAVQEAWAWNARLRFDAAAAAERAKGASFPGADRFRADQESRLSGQGHAGAVAGLGLLGLALVAATLFAALRFSRK
jgi:tetratricopeptide (TPR) repeat protein